MDQADQQNERNTAEEARPAVPDGQVVIVCVHMGGGAGVDVAMHWRRDLRRDRRSSSSDLASCLWCDTCEFQFEDGATTTGAAICERHERLAASSA